MSCSVGTMLHVSAVALMRIRGADMQHSLYQQAHDVSHGLTQHMLLLLFACSDGHYGWDCTERHLCLALILLLL